MELNKEQSESAIMQTHQDGELNIGKPDTTRAVEAYCMDTDGKYEVNNKDIRQLAGSSQYRDQFIARLMDGQFPLAKFHNKANRGHSHHDPAQITWLKMTGHNILSCEIAGILRRPLPLEYDHKVVSVIQEGQFDIVLHIIKNSVPESSFDLKKYPDTRIPGLATTYVDGAATVLVSQVRAAIDKAAFDNRVGNYDLEGNFGQGAKQ